MTPFSGTAVSLRAVPDPVFTMGTMGYGVAVIPDPDVEMVRVTAPITGVITRVQPHLYVIQAVPPESTARRILSGWRRFAEASDHPSVVVSVNAARTVDRGPGSSSISSRRRTASTIGGDWVSVMFSSEGRPLLRTGVRGGARERTTAG